MKDDKHRVSARTAIVAAVSAAALIGAGVVAANGAEGERSSAQTSVAPPPANTPKLPQPRPKPPQAEPKPPSFRPLSAGQERARTNGMSAFVARYYAPGLRAAVLARLQSSPHGWQVVRRDRALRSFVAENYGPALRGRALSRLRSSDRIDAVLERNGYSS